MHANYKRLKPCRINFRKNYENCCGNCVCIAKYVSTCKVYFVQFCVLSIHNSCMNSWIIEQRGAYLSDKTHLILASEFPVISIQFDDNWSLSSTFFEQE